METLKGVGLYEKCILKILKIQITLAMHSCRFSLQNILHFNRSNRKIILILMRQVKEECFGFDI